MHALENVLKPQIAYSLKELSLFTHSVIVVVVVVLLHCCFTSTVNI